MSNAVILNTEGTTLVQVHPVVVFQVLDRFLRRSEGQERVIGTLLGSADNGVVTVTNSFPVPHLEKGDEVAVGKDYHRQMNLLHQRVNPNEYVVGWYATSAKNGQIINENSCLIHDFYGSECDSPVHLVVDTALTGDQLNIMGFISSALQVADSALSNQFKQIKVETKTYEAESIALDVMAKNFNHDAEDSSITLPSELENLEKSIAKLYSLLEQSSEYVHKVVNGDIPAQSKIGREIMDALASIPSIRSDAFDQMFNNGLQDLLMVSYLSNLTQAQLSISERILNH